MRVLKAIADFLDRNKTKLVLAWFVSFSLYRIARHMGLFGFVGWLHSPSPFFPGIFDVILWLASVLFFFYAYYFSFRVSERSRIVLIFLAAFFLFAGFTQLSKPHWVDAQGYYDLAVLGAERGPLYLIQNYHTLNTKWSPGFVESLKTELKKLGLYDFGMQKLRPEAGEPNKYASRTSKHPPLWPLTLSLFMIAFGTGKTAALACEWIVSSLVFVTLYFLAKKHSNENTAIDITFLFMTVPSFVLSATAPLLDTAVVLFVFLSAYFLFESISKNRRRDMFLSGLFCSFAFFTKFIAVIVFMVFILYILIKSKFRKGVPQTALFITPLFIVSVIFMLFNYYFFLTLITAKASVASVTGIYNKGPVIDTMLSLYYLNYFGIPLVFLLILFASRNIVYRKNIDTSFWIFIFSFVCLLFFYPIKVGMDRHALPFFMLLFFPVATEVGKMKRKERKVFVYTALIIMILQVLLLVL